MAESPVIKPISIQITCALPFALYSEGQFDVSLRYGKATILIQRVRQERFDTRLGIEKGEFDIQRDRFGLVSYTRLTIHMQWPTFEEIARDIGGSSYEDKVMGVARCVANRVIESYRHATSMPWVRTIAVKGLFNLNANITRSDGVVEGITFGQSGVGAVTPPVKSLSDETQQAFEQNLRSDASPPIWDTLWLDSEDAVDRDDPSSVVIWGHSALETLAHATILAWLRGEKLDVNESAQRIGRNPSEKSSLKQSLSLEELVEFLNDTRKVEIALFNAVSANPPWYYYYYRAHFEELAAARNEVVHSGAEITLTEAQEHLQTIRAIRAELSGKDNLERIAQSKPYAPSTVMSDYLGRPLHNKFTALLKGYEDLGIEVTLWSHRRHPLPRHRFSSGISIVRDAKRLRIFLPPRSKQASIDVELELTWLLLNEVMIEEGWPFADVSARGLQGDLDLGPIDWGQIAVAITEVVLGWEVDRRLEQEGFGIRLRVKRATEEVAMHIKAPTFQEPQWGESDYFLLPIRLSAIFLNNPGATSYLVPLLRNKAPRMADTLEGIVSLIKKSGWKTPESAATAMLVLKSKLRALDSIGVREAPTRLLRTRFTDSEKRQLESGGRSPQPN